MFRWLLLLWLVAPSLGFAREYPLFIRVYDFTIARSFDTLHYVDLEVLRSHELSPGPEGSTLPMGYLAFRSGGYTFPVELDTKTIELVGKKAPSALSNLQRRSLLKMLRDGYITKDMFDAVEEGAGICDADQLRYFVLWSPVKVKEARELFKNKIPWDRVLLATPGDLHRIDKSRTDWVSADDVWNLDKYAAPESEIAITRASFMSVSGQVWDEMAGQMITKPLLWEKSGKFQSLGPIDRSVFPLTVEVGRLFSESEPAALRGELLHPLRALTRILTTEARLHNIPLERYATMGWTLSPSRARFDSKLFGLRPYDSAVRDWFRTSFDDAHRHYQSIPFVKPSPSEMVLIGTLDNIAERFQSDHVSQFELDVVRATEGKMSRAAARDLYLRRLVSLFRYYTVQDRFPEQDAPICLMVWDHVYRTCLESQFLYDSGANTGPLATAATHALSLRPDVSEPNYLSHRWKERGAILTVDHPESKEKVPVVFIDNIDERAVRSHPEFLPLVLASAKRTFESDYRSLTPNQLGNLQIAIEQRFMTSFFSKNQLSAVPLLMDNTWYVVRTSSPLIVKELLRLGGKSYVAKFNEPPRMFADVGERPRRPGEEAVVFNLEMDGIPEGLPASFGAAIRADIEGDIPDDTTVVITFRADMGLNGEAHAIWFKSDQIPKRKESSLWNCSEAVAKSLLLQIAPHL